MTLMTLSTLLAYSFVMFTGGASQVLKRKPRERRTQPHTSLGEVPEISSGLGGIQKSKAVRNYLGFRVRGLLVHLDFDPTYTLLITAV